MDSNKQQTDLPSFYATLSASQGGPGYIRIDAPDMACARQDLFNVFGERFCTMYYSVEQIHPADRQELGYICKTDSRVTIQLDIRREC